MVFLNSLGVITSYQLRDTEAYLFNIEKIEVPPLQPSDCFVKIECCSVGKLDLLVREGQVPGHEIVGSVVAVGSDVEGIKPGMRVGMGFFNDDYYTKFEQPTSTLSYEDSTSDTSANSKIAYGGFADGVVWDARYVYPIPKTMSSIAAAPILFTGSIAYSALCDAGIQPGNRVGVLGIGGIGHLAVQYARAWGCKVIALSTKLEKSQDALKFGAQEFYDVGDEELLTRAPKMDCILITSPVALKDYDFFISLLQPGGTLAILGHPDKPIIINSSYLISESKRVIGVAVSSPLTVMKALEFAAEKNIVSQTELLEMNEINCTVALQRVKSSSVRYKTVLYTPNYMPVVINQSW
ncbi:putative formaldehyde dehydrogenase AdhA [Trichoplax sp. H2]|uniref:Enoyl reductase (ER) domain-containing protein n=1 Tax=Trichoplax adhaerens TaxID=10228 RepID=B3RN19_TRIAD|nr:hypothetical protein TRIADDRAFT_53009 [Trichoplax adhaerens]EDV27942.1 hypothetical protein TRIADDRAFT_53009 [Trichoplax adhaerens]RDD43884.1 putative formaldehyde dehydrogenase AdhA [Trichoplax sp. H2]|eukprot:XP_002109776.1 hypothetical protein TRIADDRAFT_53009 [Trichoplax adhaerens]